MGIRDPSTDNVVVSNYIGLDKDGEAVLGNGAVGVYIFLAATDNTIGGTDPAARNVISGNSNGIILSGQGAARNTIAGNYIGTDQSGEMILGNRGDRGAGILIDRGAHDNIIGGTDPGARNVISGNNHGVIIADLGPFTGTAGNVVAGNYIGTDKDGEAALGNVNYGVLIESGARDNIIGGTDPAARNVISGNSSGGVEVNTLGNKIIGNFIDTDVSGTVALGNGRNGIGVSGEANEIGGTISGAGNIIAFNAWRGIALYFTAGTRNTILGNNIFENSSLGIDLGSNGPTPNDAGDGDSGPNNYQNFPDLTNAFISGSGDLRLTYSIDTDLVNATYPLTAEFFRADADDEEGQTFLARDT